MYSGLSYFVFSMLSIGKKTCNLISNRYDETNTHFGIISGLHQSVLDPSGEPVTGTPSILLSRTK